MNDTADAAHEPSESVNTLDAPVREEQVMEDALELEGESSLKPSTESRSVNSICNESGDDERPLVRVRSRTCSDDEQPLMKVQRMQSHAAHAAARASALGSTRTADTLETSASLQGGAPSGCRAGGGSCDDGEVSDDEPLLKSHVLSRSVGRGVVRASVASGALETATEA